MARDPAVDPNPFHRRRWLGPCSKASPFWAWECLLCPKLPPELRAIKPRHNRTPNGGMVVVQEGRGDWDHRHAHRVHACGFDGHDPALESWLEHEATHHPEVATHSLPVASPHHGC